MKFAHFPPPKENILQTPPLPPSPARIRNEKLLSYHNVPSTSNTTPLKVGTSSLVPARFLGSSAAKRNRFGAAMKAARPALRRARRKILKGEDGSGMKIRMEGVFFFGSISGEMWERFLSRGNFENCTTCGYS